MVGYAGLGSFLLSSLKEGLDVVVGDVGHFLIFVVLHEKGLEGLEDLKFIGKFDKDIQV